MSWGKRKDGQVYKKTSSSSMKKAGTTQASGTMISKYVEGTKTPRTRTKKKYDHGEFMKHLHNFTQRQKDASFSKSEAIELAKGMHKNTMFYVIPEKGLWFPVTDLIFNDTQVKGVWLIGYYNDRNGKRFNAFIIKNDVHWNELADEGRFLAINEDGTFDDDFKCRDRTDDRKNDTY